MLCTAKKREQARNRAKLRGAVDVEWERYNQTYRLRRILHDRLCTITSRKKVRINNLIIAK